MTTFASNYTQPTPCPPSKFPSKFNAFPTPQMGLKVAPTRGMKARRPARGERSSLLGWDPTMDIYDDTLAIDVAAAAGDNLGHRDTKQSSSNIQEEAMFHNANTRKRRSLLGASPAVKFTRETDTTTNLNDVQLRQQEPVRPEPTTGETDEVKKARRRTIYIPSEDTSILTIHPGASLREQARRPKGGRRSDIFLDLAALSEEEENISRQSSSHWKAKPQQRQKVMNAAPKRVPFGSSLRAGQVNVIARDVAGAGAGKENRPPGWFDESAKKGLSAKPLSEKFGSTTNKTNPVSPKPWVSGRSVVVKPTPTRTSMNIVACSISSPVSSAPASPRVTSVKRPTPQSFARPGVSRQPAVPRDAIASSPGQNTSQAPRKEWSTSRSSFAARPAKLIDQYPVLREDISNASLYTSDHLTPQEICLSQLINDIFNDAGHNNQARKPYATLRKELMVTYNTEETAQLAQRLQASLRFGALSISKDSIAKVSRIKDDLALRQDFLNLWTKTYDLELLQAAAEVVVGREICRTSRLSGSPRTSTAKSGESQAKGIQLFLRTFLLRNEDAIKPTSSPTAPRWTTTSNQSDDDINTPAWLWRRTVVRSLFLVRLLDQFKTSPDQMDSRCLFQASSAHKSSTTLLQALASMLIPSAGDVARTLGHLRYAVQHIQYPLSEYSYVVKNLAIDLRDGVMLTRLLEILFYSFPSKNDNFNDLDTTTLLLPPSPPTSGQAFPLSAHLHYPAPTRTHKMHNVRLVMIALLTQAPFNPTLRDQLVDLEPEDLVDGHREKTLRLLWTLVLGCGEVERVLDSEVLGAEVERMREECYDRGVDVPSVLSTITPGLSEIGKILFEWARYTAALQGVEVANLTTSFADGRAWAAIAQAYKGRDGNLQDVLKNKSYDKRFIALYLNAQVMDKETTVGMLAVLVRCVLGQ